MVRRIMTTSLFFIFQGQKPLTPLLKRSRLPGDRKVGKREVCARQNEPPRSANAGAAVTGDQCELAAFGLCACCARAPRLA
jgi:hypothetical protein